MCRIHDCDPWKIYREVKRTARKAHRCYECNRVITKGERYHYATGLGPDGDRWDVFHLCAHCDTASQWLVVVCGGYLYGGIREELEEHWDEDLTFRSNALRSAIHGIERGWKRRRGPGLMPVPRDAELAARLVMAPIREQERIQREVWDVRREMKLPWTRRWAATGWGYQ
jgi:hypothetical protein